MLQDKAMLIRPSWSRPTAVKKDLRMSAKTADLFQAKQSRIKSTKTLYAGSVYDQIVAADSKARGFIHEHTRPWFDDGWRILPTTTYFDVIDTVATHKETRENLVEEFIQQLPKIKECDERELGTAFNQADYDADNIRSKFHFDITFMPIPRAGDFRIDGLSPEDISAIETGAMARISEQFQSTDLWKRVYEAVSHISERLHAYAVNSSGKVENRFHDSLILNLRDLTALLPKLNIAGDSQLDAMTRRLEEDLCFYEPQMLRDNEMIRETAALTADEILAQVSAFMA